ncbi:MAG: NAD(P)H-hydrate dehydratase [Euryarchaeota archaeon]|nr:NAD(P)H-hydrate dehydratase [Euryarchaeota archaeon]
MPFEPLSPQDIRRLDENCVALGISKLQLMENAGKAVADHIRKLREASQEPLESVVIVCGLGNNGGDGFVAARHLSREFNVSVVLIGCEGSLKTKEAQQNWDVLKHLDYSITLRTAPAIFSADSPLMRLNEYNLIVDALFGTGLSGSLREPERTVVQLINQSKSLTLAIDVPSGYGTDNAVDAQHTVVLHRPKRDGPSQGATTYDIGVPLEAELYTGPGDLLIDRRPDSHKGENGRVLVIGGGPYTGAPTLSAMGAMRAGVDIVTIASPQARIIAGFSPSFIVKQVGSDRIALSDVEVLRALIEEHDAVVLGPGLGHAPETVRAVSKLIPLSQNLILDADGLRALPVSEYEAGKIIITPHGGEFGRLIGETLPADLRDRARAVRTFSRDWGVTVLLKGHVDIISDGIHCRLNKTGNPGMTVGGTGDVLAGLVGALSTRVDKMQAASAAAYLNGCAGDLAFSRFGYSLLATDVIDYIPTVLARRSM